jgi:hypothetical protein
MNDWIQEHIRTLTQLSDLSADEARQLFHQHLYVGIDPDFFDNRTYRLAFVYAVNLLSRMFPLIQFDDISENRLLLTPWGTTAPIHEQKTDPSVTLIFGKRSRQKAAGRIVTANCRDWQIFIDIPADPTPQDEWNPVLALLMACYAAARLAKILLGPSIDGAPTWRPFSILDFKTASTQFDWSATLDVGDLYVAGVGAIGSAFLFALAAHGRATGKLTLVDHDDVDSGNLGRYTFFDTHDVGFRKTDAARKRLALFGMPLDIRTVDQRFERFYDGEQAISPSFGVPRLISAPDRRDVRRQFQSRLPREVWDASTGPDQVVLHHNSFDPRLACLSCIYPETPDENAHFRHVAEMLGMPLERVMSGDVITDGDAVKIVDKYPEMSSSALVGRAFDSVFRDLCSSGKLRGSDRVVLAPFSFVSGLAGVMLYLEFVKSLRSDVFAAFHNYNYAQLHPSFPPNPDFMELRASTPNCTCQNAVVRRVFDSMWC